MANERDRDIVFEIIESIGPIKTFPNGWTKELNHGVLERKRVKI